MLMGSPPPRHQIERVRREPKRRTIEVSKVTRLTPNMVRVEFLSPALVGFESAAPDDHIKLFLPDPTSADGRCNRDYTPRAFDAERGWLAIDFAVHDAGPATAWALAATPGDVVEIGGPRGSAVLQDDFDHYLLVGDETALPSIARRVEELRPDVRVVTIVLVDGPEEVQTFTSKADLRPLWLFRKGEHVDDATLLRDAIASLRTPPGDGYVWVAAEARTARLIKTYMIEDRGHPAAWIKAAGYWVRGAAGASDKQLEA